MIIDQRPDPITLFDKIKMNKRNITIILTLMISSILNAADVSEIVQKTTNKEGKESYFFDLGVVDEISDEIAIHAKEYPPKFKDQEEANYIAGKLYQTLGILDVFEESHGSNPEYLLRKGVLHSMGHNLHFKDSANKAMQSFQKLLELKPENPNANYLFGMFLSSTAQHQKESIKYLEKSLDLGIDDSKYTLGLMYLRFGKEEDGLKYLEEYSKKHPESRATMILKAYKEGKLKFKQSN